MRAHNDSSKIKAFSTKKATIMLLLIHPIRDFAYNK